MVPPVYNHTGISFFGKLMRTDSTIQSCSYNQIVRLHFSDSFINACFGVPLLFELTPSRSFFFSGRFDAHTLFSLFFPAEYQHKRTDSSQK